MVIARLGPRSTSTALPIEPNAGLANFTSTRPLITGEGPNTEIHWSASWTELPRAHTFGTTSTWDIGGRAAFAVVMGASTLASGAAMAADTLHTTSTESIAHDALFSLNLTKKVGVGQPNVKADVTKIQEGLKSRGFDVDVDGKWGKGTERALRVFEAMVTGKDSVANTTGTVTKGGLLDRRLASSTGPRWVTMPASGTGFTNIDKDGFSHGSSVAVDTLKRAGERYELVRGNLPLIGLNDTSTLAGGHNSDHATHQAGLDMDFSLPTTDGQHGASVGQASYDREATYAMIKAFAVDPQVERILFTDAVLLKRIGDSNFAWKGKFQDGGAKHKNHFHVDVKP